MAEEIHKVKIQVRRGVESELTDLSTGEPALSTDTTKFFVGTGNGSKSQLAKQSQVDTIQTDVTNAKTNITSLQTDNTKNKQDITQLKTDTTGLRTDLNAAVGTVGDLGTEVETNTNDISTLKGTKTEVETARNGATSLDERLKGMEKADNRQSWKVTAATQTRFTLTNGSYTVGSNSFAVYIEGVLQPIDAYTQVDSKNFDMVDPVPKDVTVTAIWREGKAPIQFGHNTTHYAGGQDPLDVTKLTNYQTEVADKIAGIQDTVNPYAAGTTVSITKFGGSTALTDNIPAIQQTIDYVASLGGGTVLIPKGTFYIKPTNRNIIMKSNVTIQGVGRDLSVIKIHSSTGNWGEVFTHPVPNQILREITFKDLTMDCNVDNIVTATVAWQTHRTFINGGEGYNYLIDNCKFINNGIWVIHADISNSTLRNCEVVYDFKNFTLGWFDISTFWIAGENNQIHNNIFYSQNRANFTPETAIEFQGHNFHVHDNVCLNFTNGILPTPSTSYDNGLIVLDPGGRGIKIYNNTIEASNKGIFIWPMSLPSGYLEDLSIYNNTIVINDLVQGHSEPNAGIDFKLETASWPMSTPMKNIRIYDNYIEYKTRNVSESLYSGDAGIKAYINVNLTGLYIRDNTIVNCGGHGVALHVDTGSASSWIKRVSIIGNEFKDTKTPIWVNRNVSDVLITENVFEQFTTYVADNDNMKRTVKVANNTYVNNVNYIIVDNKIKCPSGVKPFYPIYDLSLLGDLGSFPTSRGMVLEKSTPEVAMLQELPTELNAAVTVAKGQFIRRNDGKLYKTKYNYPSTLGSLKAADGTTAVTITQWLSNGKLQLSDTTNIKPNQAISLDGANLFDSYVFYVESVVGNIVETTSGLGAPLKSGKTASDAIGSVITFYTDLQEVITGSNKGTTTYNGDGTATSKTIAHGLSATPSFFNATAASAAAGTAGIKYIIADATNLTIYFNSAPASGTNNVTIKWKAEV